MKKVLLTLSLACTGWAFATNPVSDKMKQMEKHLDQMTAKYEGKRSSDVKMLFNNGMFLNTTLEKEELKGQPDNSFLKIKAFIEKAEDAAKMRLDSCLAYDGNGKIFAKDYYFYYPLGPWPNGALQAAELYSLQADGDWYGYRQSATYDQYGNPDFRLIEELYHGGDWTPYAKYLAAYTSFGELTLDEVYLYTDGEWVGDSKRVIEYDSQNRRVLDKLYIWDNKAKEWIDYQRIEKFYEASASGEEVKEWNGTQWVYTTKMKTTTDNNGNQIKMEIFEWDFENNNWKTTMITENSYDSEGRNTLMESKTYFEEIGLVPNAKEIYMYEGNNTISESYGYNYKTSEWDGIYKTVETINNELLVESLRSVWESGSRTWVNEKKTTNEYNERELLKMTLEQLWDGTGWTNSKKAEKEYNEYGYEKYAVYFIYDSGNWVKNAESTEDTDSEGRIIYLEAYQTDPETGAWVGALKERHTYENGLEMVNEFYDWDLATNGWVLGERAQNYYSDPTSIKGVDAVHVVVAGTEDGICIRNAEGAELSVYGINGTLVRNAMISGNNCVVPAERGFYVLKINEESFKVMVK